ncbi:hypothetical protein F8M41_019946 [Gigaspora margarita]|uniref:Uncharacterized protein n=1 Tax=Gigaspora margarita TaxID=4874 RepID=A0A8H4AJC2_GIGMA|nr:hypothetical protein F8M41_019946 [Gigaspora margarita]
MELPPVLVTAKYQSTQLVDLQPRSLEWNKYYSTRTNYNIIHRCIIDSLGHNKRPRINPWPLNRDAERATHKYAGTKSNTLCSSNLQRHQRSNNFNKSRQLHSCCIFKPPRWNCIPRFKLTSRRYLEPLSRKQNQINSTIPTGELNTQVDLIPKLTSTSHRYTKTGLEQRNLIGKSFLDSYFKSSVQDDYGPSDSLLNNTRMDNVPMVPSTNEDPNRLFYTTSNT